MAEKKRGLGRGLNALLGDIPAKVAKSQMQKLPVEFMQRGKYQPRKDIDPEKLQELADSIKVQGVIQPIVVRQLGQDQYEIVAGERRWRASQLAGLHDIPVVIADIDDKTAMAIALIENIQREDLNPLEESEALRRLLEEFSMTHLQIAEAVGKSRTTVTNLLRLNDLHPDVKKLLSRRKIEMGHARALLTLDGDLQVAIANKTASLGFTVRETEKLVKAVVDGKSEKQAKAPVDKDTKILQDELTEKLGAKVSISHKSNGKGKLVIDYSSLEELEGIIERIS